MVKINQMVLIYAALIFTSSFATAETAGVGANNGGAGKGQDLQFSCQIAGALRLTLDSMKCDCNASQSCSGGQLPQDTGNCASPSNTVSNSSDTGANYTLGARPALGATVDPAPKGSVDCSGFISAGLCRAGTPFQPGKPCQDMTTQAMMDAIDKGQSCFDPVPGGSQPNLQGGEIVVYQHAGKGIGHVFAVDRVGQSCDDVSIIQSGSTKSGIGITTLKSKGAKGDDQGMAEDAVKAVNCGKPAAKGDKIKVVRFNAMKSGCQQISPRKLKNESCVNKCDVGRMMDHG